MLRVGFYQFAPKFGEVSANLSKVLSALEGAEVDIVILPELPFTGYYFQDRAEVATLAEDPSESHTILSLTNLCRANDFYLVTGFAEKAGDRIFNSALLMGPEGVQHTYRKLHLFNTEKEYFDPGDTPLQSVMIRGVSIGIMICFDWVFPEAARSLALQGADLLLHPSNLVLTYCQQTMLTRSLENSVFTITANRTGSDNRPRGSLNFTGQSQVVTPKGELLYRAERETEELFVTQIDISQARDKSMTVRNDLFKDRRPQYYAEITRIRQEEP